MLNSGVLGETGVVGAGVDIVDNDGGSGEGAVINGV